MTKRDPHNLPGRVEDRVVIGGSYSLMADLRQIKKFVLEIGMEPILARDFDVPRNDIHTWDLRLLRNCQYAIFEVTDYRGQLLELQDAKTSHMETLVIAQCKEPGLPPEDVSSMITTGGFDVRGYSSWEEAAYLVEEFLHNRKPLKEAFDACKYKFGSVTSALSIYKDGVTNLTVYYRDLTAKNLTELAVPHRFIVSSGKIEDFRAFVPPAGKWVDESPKVDAEQLRRVVEGNVKIPWEGRPIDYHLVITSKGTICLTQEEFDQQNPDDPFPFEAATQTVIWPIEDLTVECSFFPGYDISPQPIVFEGGKRRDEHIRRGTITFNYASNIARLQVRRPNAQHTYGIFWKPLTNREFQDKIKA